MVESATASRMDYAQILPRLFVGSHPRAIGDVERLRRESAITAVLNLQTDEDMRSVNLNWQPLEAHYQASGINLLRLPMKEEQIELREKLPQCVRILVAVFAAGRTVYLHCTEGLGRSPTVAIGYLHWSLGWDAESGKELLTLRGHSDPVAGVAFSPDGKRLATASADGTVQVYALDMRELLHLARIRVTRTFTPVQHTA
jgi:protein-tyrosine phosphatase